MKKCTGGDRLHNYKVHNAGNQKRRWNEKSIHKQSLYAQCQLDLQGLRKLPKHVSQLVGYASSLQHQFILCTCVPHRSSPNAQNLSFTMMSLLHQSLRPNAVLK